MQQLLRLLCGRDQPNSDPPQRDGISLLIVDEEPAKRWEVWVDVWSLKDIGSEEECLLALTMAHSVFNRKFPKKLRSLCLFIQKTVLHIDDGSKIPSSVAKLCHELM